MAQHTEEQQKVLARLRALSLENYRRARWQAIDDARAAGITWDEIAEANSVKRPAAIRMHRDGRPQD